MSEFDNTDKNIQVADSNGDGGTRASRNHIWAGLFILAIGVVLLLRQSGFDFPVWVFTWPMILIALGVLGAIKQRFRPGGWIMMLLIGGIFLCDSLLPNIAIQQYAWPILIMAVGFWIIVRPKTHHKGFAQCGRRHRARWKDGNNSWQSRDNIADIPESRDASDYIDVTSVFGGIKKIVLSKNFRGGDVVNVMGGTEVNLVQADIQSPIVIDATNIFGGTKLIVPSTWDVHSEVVAIFGGVDDKRHIGNETPNPSKIIKLTGTCLFGGIEIRSF